MTTAQCTWSTNHIENEAAYVAAIKRNIIQNAQKTWRINTHRAEEIEQTIEDGRVFDLDEGTVVYKENFIGSMAKSFDTFGKLTEKQCSAVLSGIDRRQVMREKFAKERAEQGAKSQWIGEVGLRVDITLTCVHVITIDSAYGTKCLHICEDKNKNVVIYKGFSLAFPTKGFTAKMVATVKEHQDRDGIKQTIIARPKVFV